MKTLVVIVFGMLSVWALSSCASSKKIQEVSVSLNTNDVFKAIKSVAPPSFLVRYSGGEQKRERNGMKCIEVIDLDSGMNFVWIDSKGSKQGSQIGRQGVKFWVSESGDYRSPFVLAPDRGSVFFSDKKLFVYAVKSSFRITEEDRRAYDSMIKSAQRVKGDEIDLRWKTWSRDIKMKLVAMVDKLGTKLPDN